MTIYSVAERFLLRLSFTLIVVGYVSDLFSDFYLLMESDMNFGMQLLGSVSNNGSISEYWRCANKADNSAGSGCAAKSLVRIWW